ncbi:MAG TPA: LysM domain-containing protein [Acidimicrobiales bacterium]|nr:LysM domain-containing protein [Acidimicrobiales bacterium]
MAAIEAHLTAAGGRPRHHDRVAPARERRAPQSRRCRASRPGDARTARAPAARPAARRSALAGAFIVAFATCAVWVQGGGGRTGSAPLNAPGTGRTATAAAHVWVVEPGDTLWGIAERLEPGTDVRPLVDALSRQVHGRPLQAGERLVVP